jgi:hypothetical protein
VNGPGAALFREGAVVRWMPVPSKKNGQIFFPEKVDGAIEGFNDFVPPGDTERTAGKETILNVRNKQDIPFLQTDEPNCYRFHIMIFFEASLFSCRCRKRFLIHQHEAEGVAHSLLSSVKGFPTETVYWVESVATSEEVSGMAIF